MNLFTRFFQHNWIAIFYFNFKMLPFKQAIHLPFDFYRRVRFCNLSGKVEIESNKLVRGMIKIGAQGSDMFPQTSYVIDIKGEVSFKGNCSLGVGGLLRVEKNAMVIFENSVVIGAHNKIFCESSTCFGNHTITSWECQIMDTDTHSLLDIVTNTVLPRKKPIVIGERNWIGNNVLINKGTMTSTETTIASYSLCNKDYTMLPPYCIIGGIPAKLIAKNKKRCNDKIE